MFSGPANLSKCHLRKRDKSYSKDPYFLRRKTSRNGIELRQDRYLSMRSVSNHECSFYLTCLFRTCKIIERRRALVFYSCSVKVNKVHTFKQVTSKNLCKHHRNAALWPIQFLSCVSLGEPMKKLENSSYIYSYHFYRINIP